MNTLISFATALVMAIATTRFADRKGYNGLIWFFAGGSLGLLAVLLLPDLTTPTMDVRRALRWQRIGNGIAIGLIVVSLALIFWVLGVLR